jgi:protein O-mannosyl-transferase
MELQAVVNPGDPTASRRREILLAAAIVVITLLTYLPAMRNGFIWDDDEYVTNNSLLRTPDGLRRIWLEPRSTPQYYPLVFTTFRIEHAIWGYEPAGYHVVNILLHAANALLLWRILVFLGVPGGWLAGLIFAVHPVHVESVAWITERKNVLSGFFYLAALWTALKFYLGEEPGERRWAAYGGALLLFVCALLSKTVTCSLPVAIALVLWWKRGRISWREALTLLPFLALGAALALNTAWLEKTRVGAVGPDWDFTVVQRILIAGRVPWFYLSKLVWPASLTFIYPRWTVDSAVAWQYLFPLGTLSVLAALWLLRGRIGRGPFAAAAFFVMTLAPALGFFNYYPMRFSFVADHFQYLASIGLIVLAVAAIVRWRAGYVRWFAVWCAVIAVGAFGVLAWRQCGSYKDSETLWRDTAAKNDTAWIAWNNLAAYVNQRAAAEPDTAQAAKLFQDAIGYCERALTAKPDYAEAYVTRGVAFSHLGRAELALRDCDRAIEYKRDLAEAWYLRGILRANAGRLDEALSDYSQAITLRPRHAASYCNRGNVEVRLRRYADAIRDYSDALALNAELAEAYNDRAVAYLHMKEYAKGLADMRTFQKLGGQPPPKLLKDLSEGAGRKE